MKCVTKLEPFYAILTNRPRFGGFAMTQFDVGDLALLTLDAASEIDHRLAGHPSNARILHELGDRLHRISGDVETPSMAFLQSDPLVTEIFAKAVEDTSKKTVDDLFSLSRSMKGIILSLRSDSDIDKLDLEQLKEFCLALHRSLAAVSVPSHDWESHFDDEVSSY